MGRIWDRRGEEMAKLALFLYFVNSRKTIQFFVQIEIKYNYKLTPFCIKYTFL